MDLIKIRIHTQCYIITGGHLTHADDQFFLLWHFITPPVFVCIILYGFLTIVSLEFDEEAGVMKAACNH